MLINKSNSSVTCLRKATVTVLLSYAVVEANLLYKWRRK